MGSDLPDLADASVLGVRLGGGWNGRFVPEKSCIPRLAQRVRVLLFRRGEF